MSEAISSYLNVCAVEMLSPESGIHQMLPQSIIRNSPDVASKHHPEFTRCCLEASPGIHQMLPRSIIRNSSDVASKHHPEFTRCCLKASSGIHQMLPSKHHPEFTRCCLKASSGIHQMLPQSIIQNSPRNASRHHQGIRG